MFSHQFWRCWVTWPRTAPAFPESPTATLPRIRRHLEHSSDSVRVSLCLDEEVSQPVGPLQGFSRAEAKGGADGGAVLGEVPTVAQGPYRHPLCTGPMCSLQAVSRQREEMLEFRSGGICGAIRPSGGSGWCISPTLPVCACVDWLGSKGKMQMGPNSVL